jgi:hypothetical protein
VSCSPVPPARWVIYTRQTFKGGVSKNHMHISMCGVMILLLNWLRRRLSTKQDDPDTESRLSGVSSSPRIQYQHTYKSPSSPQPFPSHMDPPIRSVWDHAVDVDESSRSVYKRVLSARDKYNVDQVT